ncbi:MAG: hypothetical protein A3D65_04630 [Candidatus Lloydbacteria bacterium RIFCSPHIGHO2_02_FULL_50_13]|uniref:Uncharacterized protein n=1 Tax=Candidatus Lloydbacteria bacterium RIFCSPHIGHO2_02_FULL_50_13 TaxID=1798661 RepID=A0A1G2D393_9BACT|nr:MAG: hypothetical protein A3D65_04630 [Candidatus Lloydbacteria bacterium RIFCSPHIGHO2_02_FULL_50_13]
MKSVTIPQIEYEVLKTRANAYARVVSALENTFTLTPPERSKKKIIAEFKKTKKYNKEFVDALERGLARSSYFKA